jgi:hypothetical protein
MIYDLHTWYLSGVPFILAVAMSVASNAKFNGILRDLGGTIRSQVNLAAVKEGINLSMMLALAYIGVWVAMLVVTGIYVVSGRTTMQGFVGHVFAFGVATLPFGLWSKAVEKRFKAMKVEATDPAVEETWRRWLKEWGQARLRLPD